MGEAIASPERRMAGGVVGIPGQGPFTAIVPEVVGDTISAAHFQTYPCPASHSCADWLVHRVTGISTADAARLTEDDIIGGVGHMPLGREHCPGLAIRALMDALAKAAGG